MILGLRGVGKTVLLGGVDITLEVDPEPGHADSGDFEADVKDVLIATARGHSDHPMLPRR